MRALSPSLILIWLASSGLALASTPPPTSAPIAPATSAPASTPTKGASGDDDFADVAVQPVAAKPSPAKAKGVVTPSAPPKLGWSQLLGRLHPLLVHLPIGWLLLLLLVELGALRPAAGAGWQRLGRGLLLATLLVVLPAVVSGLVRASALPPDPLMTLHRNVMLALVALLALALPLRLGGGERPPHWRRLGYLALLFGAVALLLWGGHLGGILVRGPNYLPF